MAVPLSYSLKKHYLRVLYLDQTSNNNSGPTSYINKDIGIEKLHSLKYEAKIRWAKFYIFYKK